MAAGPMLVIVLFFTVVIHNFVQESERLDHLYAQAKLDPVFDCLLLLHLVRVQVFTHEF